MGDGSGGLTLKKKTKCSGGDSSRVNPSVFHQRLSQNGGGPGGGDGSGTWRWLEVVVQGCGAEGGAAPLDSGVTRLSEP